MFHANRMKKKAGVTLSDNIDFETKVILRDKESQYIPIKGIIQQEDITLINIYTRNTGEPKHVEQILMDLKGEDDISTVLVRAFNTPLTSVDRFPDGKPTGIW